MTPPAGYRPCVGLAVFNRDGLVFVGRRADKTLREHVAPRHDWQMPQGGVDPGEDLKAAALRELREETGIVSVSVLGRTPDWLSYDLPADIAAQAWKRRWRGQAQIWFALRFEGRDDEIDVLSPPGGHKAEFDAWRWVPLAETPELIIPFKRPVYEQVAAQFARYAEP